MESVSSRPDVPARAKSFVLNCVGKRYFGEIQLGGNTILHGSECVSIGGPFGQDSGKLRHSEEGSRPLVVVLAGACELIAKTYLF